MPNSDLWCLATASREERLTDERDDDGGGNGGLDTADPFERSVVDPNVAPAPDRATIG